MVSEFQDQCRQPMQVIISATGNIRAKLKMLGVDDDDITQSQQSVERAVKRLDALLSLNDTESKT